MGVVFFRVGFSNLAIPLEQGVAFAKDKQASEKQLGKDDYAIAKLGYRVFHERKNRQWVFAAHPVPSIALRQPNYTFGLEAWFVGYGNDYCDFESNEFRGFGTKRGAGFQWPGRIWTGRRIENRLMLDRQKHVGACPGDSGGPLMISSAQLEDTCPPEGDINKGRCAELSLDSIIGVASTVIGSEGEAGGITADGNLSGQVSLADVVAGRKEIEREAMKWEQLPTSDLGRFEHCDKLDRLFDGAVKSGFTEHPLSVFAPPRFCESIDLDALDEFCQQQKTRNSCGPYGPWCEWQVGHPPERLWESSKCRVRSLSKDQS